MAYGYNGDSTMPNSNFIRDILFGGDEKKYEVVSTLIGAVGLYTGFVNYPMLAGTSATALIPGRGMQGYIIHQQMQIKGRTLLEMLN